MTTAMLVIDMQNGFCHPDAGIVRNGGDRLPDIDRVIKDTAAALRSARSAGYPVFFTKHQWLADRSDAPPRLKQMLAPGVLAAGTWDVEILEEMEVADVDHVVEKNRFDGFLNTTLDQRLRLHGVDSLVMAGVLTNICVESTARSASMRDYSVTVLSDCTQAQSQTIHDRSLEALNGIFADIKTWQEALES